MNPRRLQRALMVSIDGAVCGAVGSDMVKGKMMLARGRGSSPGCADAWKVGRARVGALPCLTVGRALVARLRGVSLSLKRERFTPLSGAFSTLLLLRFVLGLLREVNCARQRASAPCRFAVPHRWACACRATTWGEATSASVPCLTVGNVLRTFPLGVKLPQLGFDLAAGVCGEVFVLK